MPHKDAVGWEAITADAVLARGPVYVFSVAVQAAAGGTAVAAVYDGQNANAGRSFNVQAPANGQTQLRFDPPLPFQRGLFVDLDANCTEVLVSFAPLRDDPVEPPPEGP